MRGIVYVSEARVYFDEVSLDLLAADAESRNIVLGISGYLYFESDRFVQYIEGDEHVVDALIASIGRDRRHRILHQVVENDLRERRFPSWQMRRLRRPELASIQLENLHSDYLSYLESNRKLQTKTDSSWDTVVWRMIRRLSEARGRLSFH